MEYTIDTRKLLVEKIEKLTKVEHQEIFKIFNNHSIKYTKNMNGFFFNITEIPDNIIEEIENVVKFYLNNKKELDDMQKTMIKYHMINKNTEYEINYDHVENNMPETNENWESLLNKKDIQKINLTIDDIISSRNKKYKSEFNDKFVLALKKYIHYFNTNKKIDNENIPFLFKEQYSI